MDLTDELEELKREIYIFKDIPHILKDYPFQEKKIFIRRQV